MGKSPERKNHAMKKIARYLLTFLAASSFASGSPDHAMDLREEFLGSNDSGFAVLRIETDNQRSYYSDASKVMLQESVI